MPRRESQIHSGLRLTDLASEPVGEEKLLSVRLPLQLLDQLDGVCDKLGARKSEVVVALLNEGLQRYGSPRGAKAGGARKAKPRKQKAGKKKR